MKHRHSVKYDSSSNYFFALSSPASAAHAMCLLLRRRGGCARLASFLQSSGTSASAIKVACTPISSPVSDKCLGFSHHWSLRVGHRTCPSQNTHTHAFHCLSLSDPMNDRSKDCARRHSARQLGVLLSFLTLAHCRHSAPISGGAGFLLCAAHVHLVSMWSWGGACAFVVCVITCGGGKQ